MLRAPGLAVGTACTTSSGRIHVPARTVASTGPPAPAHGPVAPGRALPSSARWTPPSQARTATGAVTGAAGVITVSSFASSRTTGQPSARPSIRSEGSSHVPPTATAATGCAGGSAHRDEEAVCGPACARSRGPSSATTRTGAPIDGATSSSASALAASSRASPARVEAAASVSARRARLTCVRTSWNSR
jgi:hypothetical protein